VNKAILLGQREGIHLSPTQVGFWSIAIGWVVLVIVLAARRRLGHVADIAPRGWLVLAAMGFFGWAGYVVALNFAFTRLPLPDAIVINYLHPVFVVAFQGSAFSGLVKAVSHFEQSPDRTRRPGAARIAAGLVLCLLGVAVIATEGHLGSLGQLRSTSGGFAAATPRPSGLGAAGALAGAASALFAAFSWGVYSNLGRFVSARPGRQAAGFSDLHSFLAMSFGLVMMAAHLLAARKMGLPNGYHTSLWLLGREPAEVNVWVLMIGMGLLVYCGGFTLWLYALELGARLGGVHRLPPLTYLTPVLGIGLGWVILHEGFGPGFWEGAVLIAAGNAFNLLAAPPPAR
jgi:drug/metabolite transporter (DMT)-like permease